MDKIPEEVDLSLITDSDLVDELTRRYEKAGNEILIVWNRNRSHTEAESSMAWHGSWTQTLGLIEYARVRFTAAIQAKVLADE